MEAPLKKIKRLANRELPDPVFAKVANLYYSITQTPVRMAQQGDFWIGTDKHTGENFIFPTPSEIPELREGYMEKVWNRYINEEFFEFDTGDTVVDIGAFVGAFSCRAAQEVDTVIAIEPDERNYSCLRRNVDRIGNVQPIQAALWCENTQLEFKIGKDPTDHSLLNVDYGSHKDVIIVDAHRLDHLLKNNNVSSIDFLKVDAEGAELEVLEGAADITIRQIAVDVSPERFGDTAKNDVVDLLSSRGYEIRESGKILQCRLTENG